MARPNRCKQPCKRCVHFSRIALPPSRLSSKNWTVLASLRCCSLVNSSDIDGALLAIQFCMSAIGECGLVKLRPLWARRSPRPMSVKGLSRGEMIHCFEPVIHECPLLARFCPCMTGQRCPQAALPRPPTGCRPAASCNLLKMFINAAPNFLVRSE